MTAEACPSSPSPLLSCGGSQAAPVAARVWALPAPALPRAGRPCPPSRISTLTSSSLPSHPLRPHPGHFQDQEGEERASAVACARGTRPGVTPRWPGGWTKAAPPRPAWGPSRCCFSGRDTPGAHIPPARSAVAPAFPPPLRGGSPGPGHHCRPHVGWCLRPCGHSSPLGQGCEVARGVLALRSVLGVSPGPLFLPVLPKSLASPRASE